MPATLLPPRWALTPPFHPYLRANHADIPKVFLRSATGLRSAGGIFSVALSVTRPLARPHPLALPGALPTPLARFRCPDFPPAYPSPTLRWTQGQPAIVQLTRQLNSIAISAISGGRFKIRCFHSAAALRSQGSIAPQTNEIRWKVQTYSRPCELLLLAQWSSNARPSTPKHSSCRHKK